jgi:hypothetical protein
MRLLFPVHRNPLDLSTLTIMEELNKSHSFSLCKSPVHHFLNTHFQHIYES